MGEDEVAEPTAKLTQKPKKRAKVVKEAQDATNQPTSRRKVGKRSKAASIKGDAGKAGPRRAPSRTPRVAEAQEPPASTLRSRLRPRKPVNYEV